MILGGGKMTAANPLAEQT